jgi:hypothetical protein
LLACEEAVQAFQLLAKASPQIHSVVDLENQANLRGDSYLYTSPPPRLSASHKLENFPCPYSTLFCGDYQGSMSFSCLIYCPFFTAMALQTVDRSPCRWVAFSS